MRKQSPEPGQNGGTISQESIAGRKLITVFGGSALNSSITVSAGGFGSFQSSLSVYDSLGNLLGYDEILPWAFATFFIDTYDDAHRYKIGSSTGLISIGSQIMRLSPGDGFTHNFIANVYNGDGSSHVIYMDLDWRVLRTLPLTI